MATLDSIITSFVNSYNGFAFITELDTTHVVLENDNHREYMKSCECMFDNEHQPLFEANLCFCKYVEERFRESLCTTFATENFCQQSFVSIRTLIKFRGKESILTLINKSNANEILQNHVAQC